MNRSILVVLLLCVMVSGFAKKEIVLKDQFRSPQPPIEVFIDEESRELTLDLKNGKENIKVIITDFSGNSIYNNEVKMEGIYVLPLPMIGKGKYVLYIFLDEIELQGFFEINNY